MFLYFCGKLNGFKMFSSKQFCKNTFALVLLGAFLLPTAVQFASAFESHNHFICNEQQIHVHQSVIECETCTFNYSPYHFSFVIFTNLEVVLTPEATKVSFASLLFHSFNITNTKLRGPPVLA
jgi:hypothetical protein